MNTRKTVITDSCGKMRFATARAARLSALKKGQLHGSRFRVYKCWRCLGCHLATR